MARLVWLFGTLLLMAACSPKLKTTESATGEKADAVSQPKAKPQPEMTFEKDFVDFGTVKKGEKRTHVYTFTNTGNADLVIDLITACDCTTLTYDRTKIYAPGEGGEIKAVFDSSEKETSEIIDIDIILKNEDENGYPIIKRVKYRFDIEQH